MAVGEVIEGVPLGRAAGDVIKVVHLARTAQDCKAVVEENVAHEKHCDGTADGKG